MAATPETMNLWSALRRHTAARIGLGRSGGSPPTAAVLDFSASHAAARDAVHAPLDVPRLQAELAPLGLPLRVMRSRAPDRTTYLQRPDLGRKLDPGDLATLRADAMGPTDVALVLGDGLSAPALQSQAAPVLKHLLPLLASSGLRVAQPICIVQNARVAIEDDIGLALGAKLAVILLGERPGLGTSQSLGAYLVYDPRPGRTDAERNCISNIRPGGLSAPAAAETLCYLMRAALQRRISGVGLKDERPTLAGEFSATLE